MSEERNARKVLIGKVVSDKMDKTIVVAVETYKTQLVPQTHQVYEEIQST